MLTVFIDTKVEEEEEEEEEEEGKKRKKRRKNRKWIKGKFCCGTFKVIIGRKTACLEKK